MAEKKLTGPDLARGISLSQLADGNMLQGYAKGEPILVARRGDGHFAIGAICTPRRRSGDRHPRRRHRPSTCPYSKLNPPEFIGGFDLSAIACSHGDGDKRSARGRRKRAANPHFAAVGIDSAAPSNFHTEAEPNPSPMLSVY